MRVAPLLLLAACAPPSAQAPARASEDTLELVESEPVETALDRPEIPDAWRVWPEMFDGAKRAIDLEELYASSSGPEDRLEPSLLALERAAARGVTVRAIFDAKFEKTYPEVPARLARAGAKVKITARFAGVQHAKFFVIDGERAYLGSQNFDYRSLEHIQELGVRARSRAIAGALLAVFESDFADRTIPAKTSPATVLFGGEPARVTPLFSPRGELPDEGAWDLPRLVQALDAAKTDVRVQVLTYDVRSRDGSPFPTLDDALRRAASRGARVRVLVSEWARKHPAALRALAEVSNVTIKVMTIPPIPNKDIPFARVVHAKYMVCDDALSWIGTSNWEGDYFDKSRNAGLLLEGKKPASELAAFFDRNFESIYAAPL